MVWSASTFWAETSQGATKAEWSTQLQKRNVSSPSRSRSAPLVPPRPQGHMTPDEEEAYENECKRLRKLDREKKERNRRLRDMGKYVASQNTGDGPLKKNNGGNVKVKKGKNNTGDDQQSSRLQRPVTPQAPAVKPWNPKRFLSPIRPKEDETSASPATTADPSAATRANEDATSDLLHQLQESEHNQTELPPLSPIEQMSSSLRGIGNNNNNNSGAGVGSPQERGHLPRMRPSSGSLGPQGSAAGFDSQEHSRVDEEDFLIDSQEMSMNGPRSEGTGSQSNSRTASPTALAAAKKIARAQERERREQERIATKKREAEEQKHREHEEFLAAMTEEERKEYFHRERLKKLLGTNIVSNRDKKIVPPRVGTLRKIAPETRKEEFEEEAEAHIRRAEEHLQEKVHHLRCASAKRKAYTSVVVERHELHIKKKEDSAKLAIAQRERRFKDPIDQCETQEDTNELRAVTFMNILPHVLMIRSVRRIMIEHRMIKKLRLLLVPMIRLKIAKRLRTARVMAGIWRGRIERPSVDFVREHFSFLMEWPERHLKALIRSMKHVAYAPGEIVAFQGEPNTSCFLLTTGRVLIQQRSGEKGKYHMTDLGERGPGYVHAEEALTKSTRSRHFLKLVAREHTYGWALTRKHYLKLASVLPCANMVGREAASLNAAAGAGGGSLTMQPSQLMENRCFIFWSVEEIKDLIASAEQISFDRDEVIFEMGERAKCCYVVWKGTVKLETPVQPPPSKAGGGGMRAARAAATTTSAGGQTSGSMKPLNSTVQLNATQSSANLMGSVAAANASGILNATSTSELAQTGSGSPLPKSPTSPLPQGSNRQASFSAAPKAEFGVVSKGTHHHLVFNPNRRHEWATSYVNVGQVFGEEGVIFNTCCTAKAVAATECVVYKLNATPVIDGMYTNPGQFCALKDLLNQQRAQRYLLRPMSVELQAFMPQASSAFFVRNMSGLVLSCGEALPVHNSIVFLQSGQARISRNEGSVTFNAPCIIAPPEAFNAIAEQYNKFLESGLVTTTDDFGGDLNVSSASAADGTGGGGGSSVLSKLGRAVNKINADRQQNDTSHAGANLGKVAMAALADAQNQAFDPELGGIQVINRTLCRCDCWVVKTHHFLKKFRNATKLQDLLLASCVATQTPQKPGEESVKAKGKSSPKKSFRKKVA